MTPTIVLVILAVLFVLGLMGITAAQWRIIEHQRSVVKWCEDREKFFQSLYHAVRGAVPREPYFGPEVRQLTGEEALRYHRPLTVHYAGPGQYLVPEKDVVNFVWPLQELHRAAQALESYEREHPVPIKEYPW